MGETWKVGDEVVVKSGGPVMTVESADCGDGLVTCVWFAKDDLRREAFPPAVLRRYEPPSAEDFPVSRRDPYAGY